MEYELRKKINPQEFRDLFLHLVSNHGNPQVLHLYVVTDNTVKKEKNIVTKEIDTITKKVIEKKKLGKYSYVITREIPGGIMKTPTRYRLKVKYIWKVENTSVEVSVVYQSSILLPSEITKESQKFFAKFPESGPEWDSLSEYIIEFEIEFPNDIEPTEAVKQAMLVTGWTGGGEMSSHDIIVNLATLLGIKYQKTFKQMINKPKQIDIYEYASDIFPHISDYHITHKLNGERAWYISHAGNDNAVVLTSFKTIEWSGADMTLVLDCEMYDSVLYAFDILVHRGEVVYEKSYEERLELLYTLPKIRGIEVKYVEKCNPSQFARQVQKFLAIKDIDGLILTPPSGYFTARVMKWKPRDQLSIDFLLVCEDTRDPDKYSLYCGLARGKFHSLDTHWISREHGEFDRAYAPAWFKPAINPGAGIFRATGKQLHMCVCELVLNPDGNGWTLLRVRAGPRDYSIGYGNDWEIAESIYMQCLTNFNVEKLINPPPAPYFQSSDKEAYKGLTKYNMWVKQRVLRNVLMNQPAPGVWAKSLIDIAAGRGADLFTYNALGIKFLRMTDNDMGALMDLCKRRYNLSNARVYNVNPIGRYIPGTGPGTGNAVVVRVSEVDCGASAAVALTSTWKCGVESYGYAVCNFAIHYFISEQFVEYINALVCPGGYFIFTCFDGDFIKENIDVGKVFALKHDYVVGEDLDASLDASAFANAKYWIKRVDENHVEVKHHFAKNPYKEKLVTSNDIVLFTNKGWKIVECNSFDYFMKESLIQQTDADKAYSSLYQYVVLKKQ